LLSLWCDLTMTFVTVTSVCRENDLIHVQSLQMVNLLVNSLYEYLIVMKDLRRQFSVHY
jgi:hypothetical protein